MSPPDNDKSEGFLSAWSRRKLAARREMEEPEAAVEQDDTKAVETEDAAIAVDAPGDPEQEEVDDDFIAALPSIDDITDKTDLAPFMRRGVPLGMRNAALRKVWMLNPLIRDHVDPALDYAWDWNAPGGVPGGGGTLTSESVAQMVKSVFGEKTPVDDADASDEETAALEADTEEVQAAAVEAAPTQSVRQIEPQDAGEPEEESADGASATGDASDHAADDRVNLSLTTIRRHGGALPE